MRLEDVPTVVLVASGKGGVGKTTVASDLARAFDENGHSVGLIDADISTPNTAEVVGGEENDLSDQRLSTGDALVPPTVNGIQLASKGVVLPDDVPVLRDGQWRAETVADYVRNVEWADDTDIVVIDSPPGTGEELQVIASIGHPDLGVIVTTPHPSSIRDAKKTHEFFEQAEIEHVAALNMAYIPHLDLIEWVDDGTDFEAVKGVGENTIETIREQMLEGVESFPLFGYDPDNHPDFPVHFAASIPYTEDHDARVSSLDGIIEHTTEKQEVEA